MDNVAKFVGWIGIAFPMLPSLGLGQAIGLRMLVGAVSPINPTKNDDDYTSEMKAAVTFFVLTFTLGMGWIVHQFV